MKVKEYLVNRILELEKELKQLRSEYNDVLFTIDNFRKVNDELCQHLDDFEIEREHIKEIITCNTSDNEIKLVYPQCDYETLLAILDIKPEDYKEVTEDAEAKD